MAITAPWSEAAGLAMSERPAGSASAEAVGLLEESSATRAGAGAATWGSFIVMSAVEEVSEACRV